MFERYSEMLSQEPSEARENIRNRDGVSKTFDLFQNCFLRITHDFAHCREKIGLKNYRYDILIESNYYSVRET